MLDLTSNYLTPTEAARQEDSARRCSIAGRRRVRGGSSAHRGKPHGTERNRTEKDRPPTCQTATKLVSWPSEATEANHRTQKGASGRSDDGHERAPQPRRYAGRRVAILVQ